MKEYLVRKGLVLALIFLFMVSVITPMTVGYKIRITNENIVQSTISSDGPMDSAWPMFHHDVRHTGRSSYGKSGNWCLEKWKADIGSMVFSSPAIDKDGTIYIGSNNWYFYAIKSILLIITVQISKN